MTGHGSVSDSRPGGAPRLGDDCDADQSAFRDLREMKRHSAMRLAPSTGLAEVFGPPQRRLDVRDADVEDGVRAG